MSFERKTVDRFFNKARSIPPFRKGREVGDIAEFAVIILQFNNYFNY